jgi:hypothetical protein
MGKKAPGREFFDVRLGVQAKSNTPTLCLFTMRGDDKFSQNFSLPRSTPANDELWFGEVEEAHYNQPLFCNVEPTDTITAPKE